MKSSTILDQFSNQLISIAFVSLILGYYFINTLAGESSLSFLFTILVRFLPIILIFTYLIIFYDRIFFSPYLIIFFIFFLIYLLRIIYSIAYDTGNMPRDYVRIIAFLLFSFLLPYLFFSSTKGLRFLILGSKYLLFVSFICSFYVCYIAIFNSSEFIQRIVINERVNPITIGEGASFGVVISYYFLPTQNQVFKKFLLIFFISICFGALVLSGSRGPLIGTILSIIFLMIFNEKIKTLLILFLISALLLFFFWESLEIFRVFSAFIELADFKQGGRVDLFNQGLIYFFTNPFFGHTYALEGGIYPHNIFIEILMSTGIFGFLSIFSLVLIGAYKTITNLKLADEYKLFAALFTLASLSALVSGNIITSSSFWIFLALALNPFFERYET